MSPARYRAGVDIGGTFTDLLLLDEQSGEMISGRDQRRYSLIAFGGAGPIHASRVAETRGNVRPIFPRHQAISTVRSMTVISSH